MHELAAYVRAFMATCIEEMKVVYSVARMVDCTCNQCAMHGILLIIMVCLRIVPEQRCARHNVRC